MLQLNKELQKTINNLLKYILSDYPMEKPSTKLQNWHELDFPEFKNELNKNINKENRRRRKADEKELPSLTKSEEMEWMELFETKRAEAQKLVDEIEKTDKEIDKLVYKLYDLTYEEIKIVDPETDITEEEWG